MLLKGNQRGGSRQLAIHLMNGRDNEHVEVHEISGFVSDTVIGALNEAYAVSKGTKATQFMYSLSLSPPPEEDAPTRIFEAAVNKVEKELNLVDQPRIIVFHEKHGRRHAHCVWSRIDITEMKAIPMSHDHRKLHALSKDLYLEQGWQMPPGFRDKSLKNPLNFTRAEWQQALRHHRSPSEVREQLRECWGVSDDKASFENALQECGYWLARGDKKNIALAVDLYGELHPLRRKIGIKQKDMEARLGDAASLPSLEEAKDKIAKTLSPVFEKQLAALKAQHEKQAAPLGKEKQTLAEKHQLQRLRQKELHEARWREEEQQRQDRIRTGGNNMWDKINGRYWRMRSLNEKETWAALSRDSAQRDALLARQLEERQALEEKINALTSSHVRERQELIRDLSRNLLMEEELRDLLEQDANPDPGMERDLGIEHDFDIDI